MRTDNFTAVKAGAGRIAALFFCAALLAACTTKAPGLAASKPLTPQAEPEAKVIDFQQVDCARIWDLQGDKASHNALYWLRGIDCAGRLSPAEARAEARRWPANNWQNAFRQGVLLANGNVTPVERRQYMQRLALFSPDYPPAVRPLIQLWRNGQSGQLQLAAERMRYYQLRQSSDTELDTLRQRLIEQNEALSITRRKLETLTDIERQLSSRRSPETSESSHAADSDGQPDDDVATPGATKEEASQP
ncbi:two-component system QseEF-associated lipoprotein QseG [Pantoea sp. FN060301]|uniref:two-component system QseEF-associated lipoprotein QseG n=1 Tax=Pantoea sp. FN060301 TaxID=3420380 RepID=UPI003D17D1B2